MIPALIRKMLEGHDEIVLWGDGTPTREFLYVDDCVDGIALAAERYDGARAGQPRHRRRDVDPRARRAVADVTGFEGEIVWDTSMPNGQPRRGARRVAAPRELFGFAAHDAAARGARAHGRLVPVATRGACRRLTPRSGSCRLCPSTAGGPRGESSKASRWPSRGRSCRWPCSSSLQWLAIIVFALTVAPQRLALLPGRRPDLAADDRLAARSAATCRRPGIGYGWPLVVAPLMAVAGPSFLAALPVGDRAPMCSCSARWRCGRLRRSPRGSRARCSAYWPPQLWVVMPVRAIPLCVDGYHAQYVEQFLPRALGLTGLGDFPSMVLLLVGALALLAGARDAGDPRRPSPPVSSIGFAVGVKPANGLFLAAPVLGGSLARNAAAALAVRARAAAGRC